MLVQPTFESCLEFGEVDYSANGVNLGARDVKVGDIIVAMKELTLATMLVKSVSCTKLDATIAIAFRHMLHTMCYAHLWPMV